MSNEDPKPIWSMDYNGKHAATLTVFGVPIGTPDDLAALARDARRFRKLEREHDKRDDVGELRKSISSADYVPTPNDFLGYGGPVHKPLAAIADALPEVEQK